MVIVNTLEKTGTIEIRGKLGKPNELGEIWCGWSECGEYLPIAGYYQKRRSAGKQVIVRTKHYHCTNPQTAAQQANRITFANAVAAWQSLTDSEKNNWRKKKYPRYMSGYNRFLRQYMRGTV